jgi:hypothetical protein
LFAATCHFFLRVTGSPLKTAGIFCLCFFLAPACAYAAREADSPAGELRRLLQPQKIFSVRSPFNFFDYDGSSSSLDLFEQWMETISREANHPLKKFGYYPGSLGNYAGHERSIFTLTLELPSSDPKQAPGYFRRFFPGVFEIHLSVGFGNAAFYKTGEAW